MFRIIVFNILSISFLIPSDLSIEYSPPNELYQILKSNEGWSRLDEEEAISIFSKTVSDHDISAIMVSKDISIPLDIIQSVIMDVENYGSILSNTGNMITRAVEIRDSIIIAYQFIPIDIPFIDNRHYYFKLKINKILTENEPVLVDWYLMDKNILNFDIENSDALYLKYGAGVWKAKKDNLGKVILTYRIFMDPNGSIPNFIIDKINEISIINLFKDVIKESERRFIEGTDTK